MHVCTYVCTYACMYVHMYACMYAHMYAPKQIIYKHDYIWESQSARSDLIKCLGVVGWLTGLALGI